MAPESGKDSAGPNRPDAASPTGWFQTADGEAAPPFRLGTEPARSDETSEASDAADNDQDRAWYQDPQPTSLHPGRALWPWSLQTGSRHVPVVGPTEALRGRAGGPGMAVPPGAVPGLLDPAQRSGWQLAQQVWQESGVAWEIAGLDASGTDFAGTDFAEAEPAETELNDADPNDADPNNTELDEARPNDALPADMEFAATWSDDAEAADAESADHAAVDIEPADIAPAQMESGGTWFDGTGPADPRLSAPRRVGERRTVVEFSGPYFADSGVVPMPSDFRSPEIPRRPTFTPIDNSQSARTGPPRSGSPPRSGPPRSAPARPHRLRQESMAEDPERDGRIRFGTDQAGRAQRPGPGWNDYPPSGFPGQTWPVGSGQVPLGAPVALDEQAPGAVGSAEFAAAAPPLRVGGALPLSEPDELFRAWQGSVREAAAPRTPWSAARRGATPGRRRALQVAAIGVPAAVIVTVGAGALILLTGKANDMLAPQANTGAPSQTASDATASASSSAAPSAFARATLAGYPGQHGTVTVDSMQVAGGVTVAVGTADGHPAIWHRAANGSWTLESAAALGAVDGRASLTSVAHGQAGWIAVGTDSDGGATKPVVLASADGVTWRPLAALATLAAAGTEFLGTAAGRDGYVVVGRQMIGGRIFAVLWYSADLRNWTSGSNGGLDGRLQASTVNAVAAITSGFIAVGSHGAVQAIWISPDGKQWNLRNVSPPSGAHSATLGFVAASGTRVVAAGYADTPAGDIPVLVVSVDSGAHWQQIVLPAPSGLGVITALTATPDGFTAAGLAGKHGAVHAVTWTSKDGLTWSQPSQASAGEITALTAAGTNVIGASERGATPTVMPLPAP